MITSYDGFCTLLTFEQDELGEPYSCTASQINSPRILHKPESKTKKKKKSSPKQAPKDENKAPNGTAKIDITMSIPVEPTRPVALPMETEAASKLDTCDTPKRPILTTASINNKLITPTKEQDTVLTRITPTKVEDVLKNREEGSAMVVIDLSDDSSDCVKPAPKPSRRLGLTKVD